MNSTIKKAMVMAAGLGKRMAPLTNSMPKPLIDVGGRTLLDRTLDRLQDAGLSEVIVNVHYFADQVEAHLAERPEPKTVISDERDALLETGGGIRKALPLIGEQPFFSVNSDAFYLEDGAPVLSAMIETWDPVRMDALLLLAPLERSTGFDGAGDFKLLDDGRVERRGSESSAPFAYAGIQIIKPELFLDSELPDGAFSTNIVWNKLLEKGSAYGFVLEGTWMHVGTPDGIKEAELALAKGGIG